MKLKQLFVLSCAFALSSYQVRAQVQDENGTYLIASVEDLKNFSSRVSGGEINANAVLMNDIDLKGEQFTPIGLYSDDGKPGVKNGYRGKFDGKGYVIKNLKVYQEDYYECGFFSRCSSGAQVRNLGIINADITSTMGVRCGALSGEIENNCQITNCFTAGTITLTTENIKEQMGGIAGEVHGSCHLSNCYTVYDILVKDLLNGSTAVNCYEGAEVAEKMGTGELCYLLNGDQSNIAYYQTLEKDAYPVLDASHARVYARGEVDCAGRPVGDMTYTNDGEPAVLPEHEYDENGYCIVCGKDAGTIEPAKDGWYEVTDGNQLRYIARLVNGGNTGINVRLMNDINLEEISNFPPIGFFNDNGAQHAYGGTFDGQYHIIYNLTVNISDGSEAGLFSRAAGATLKNFGVVNAQVTNGAEIRAGIVAGEAHNCTIQNVFSAGALMVSTSHAQQGGFSGEAAGSNLTNCWTTYEVLTNAPGSLTNCYWGPETAEKALTGELCYILNGKTKDKSKAMYFQTLEEDEFPIFDSTHGFVYYKGEDGYASATTPEEFAEMVTFMIETEVQAWEDEDLFVSKTLRDAYLDKLHSMSGMSYEEYLKAWEGAVGLRESLEKSRAAYKAYADKIEEVSAYIAEHDAEFAGPDRDRLENYLNNTVEPGDEFANGSYAYILNNPTLSTIAMLKETTFVEEMLNDAVNKGYMVGANVTSMIVNPTFTQANVGWTVENAGWPSMNNAAGPDGIPFGFISGNAKVSQTLTNLKNGVYLFRLHSYMEIHSSTPECAYNFIGFFFANDMANYTHSKFTDLFYPEEVEGRDGFGPENGVFDDEGVQLYGCNGFNGVSQGFGMGHYDNCVLANVTDGTLTIGVHNKGAFARVSESFLADARLYYCGEMEEASAAIDEVLGDMIKKAELICYKYVPSPTTYTEAPAFSKALTEELETMIAEAKNAADNQAKYEYIGKFTDIFQRIYDCKAAYLEMIQTLEETQSAVYELSQDQELLEAFEKLYAECVNHYIDADITQEEAETRIAELKGTVYYKLAYGEEAELVDNAYQLSTPYNLVWFSKKVNSGNHGANGVLTADIDMSSINNFTPIGLYSDFNDNKHSYSGIFDGQGHIISNLKIDQANKCEAGLFSRTAGCTLKNFGVVNAHVTNQTVDNTNVRAGVVAGECHNCTVENVFTAGELIVETEHEQCGGIFGEAASSSLKNCYTTHPVMTASGSLTNCIADAGAIAPTGELAFRMNENLDEPVYFQNLDEDAYPVLNAEHKVVYAGGRINCAGEMVEITFGNDPDLTYTRDSHEFGDDNLCIHCGETIDACEKDKDGYFLIATAKNLVWFSEHVNKGNESVSARLTADIDMSGLTIAPIGRFINKPSEELEKPNLRYSGTFDGQGHVIRNLHIVSEAKQNTGLIGDLFGGNIYNVGIENVTVECAETAGTNIGALCGHGINAKVRNCFVIGEITLASGGARTGTMIAHLETGEMNDCFTTYQSLGSSNGNNCYFGVNVAETAASGKLCFLLNKSKFVDPVWFQTLGEDKYPVLDSTHAVVYPAADAAYTNDMPDLMKYAGTAEDPFIIKSAQDLCNVSTFMTEDTLNYIVLANDIDMSGVTNWVPLNLSKKWIDFDGQGHVIRNFCDTTNLTRNLSLFGIFAGRLRNLGVENASIATNNGDINNDVMSGAGILGGYVGHSNYKDTTYVEHVYVTGNVAVNDRSYAGGMFGAAAGPLVMHNCYANVNLRCNAGYVGGIIGRLRTALTMENCYAAGEFNRGGGIIGGGQEAGTPASNFSNVVVWNNDYENFGDLRVTDNIEGISYYYGNNFAELQKTVVAWDPTIWSCDMEEGSYPVLVGTVTGILDIWSQNLKRKGTYDLQGRKLNNNGRLPKGIYVIDGKKVIVK